MRPIGVESKNDIGVLKTLSNKALWRRRDAKKAPYAKQKFCMKMKKAEREVL